MKKLITLLSLTMAITAFGAPQGDVEKTDKMNITATVIKPLTVTAEKSMEFGKVIQGTTATADSSFTIDGQKKENITVTIPAIVELSNGTNKLNVAIERTIPTNLGDTGTIRVPVTGSIVTSDSTATGVYSGTLTARVQYN